MGVSYVPQSFFVTRDLMGYFWKAKYGYVLMTGASVSKLNSHGRAENASMVHVAPHLRNSLSKCKYGHVLMAGASH
jgi:hypothetical protein